MVRKEFLSGQADREVFGGIAGRKGYLSSLSSSLLCLWDLATFETSFAKVLILLSVPRKKKVFPDYIYIHIDIYVYVCVQIM